MAIVRGLAYTRLALAVYPPEAERLLAETVAKIEGKADA